MSGVRQFIGRRAAWRPYSLHDEADDPTPVQVPVIIRDAKWSFGWVFLVQPEQGSGERWVRQSSLTFQEEADDD